MCPCGVAVCPCGVAVCPRGVAVCPRGIAVCPRGIAVCPRGTPRHSPRAAGCRTTRARDPASPRTRPAPHTGAPPPCDATPPPRSARTPTGASSPRGPPRTAAGGHACRSSGSRRPARGTPHPAGARTGGDGEMDRTARPTRPAAPSRLTPSAGGSARREAPPAGQRQRSALQSWCPRPAWHRTCRPTLSSCHPPRSGMNTRSSRSSRTESPIRPVSVARTWTAASDWRTVSVRTTPQPTCFDARAPCKPDR